MALLDLVLWRGVLAQPTDPEPDLLANLSALRGDVAPEGIDAHLLTFVGGLVDRTGKVPAHTLVRQHYDTLSLQGDANGLSGCIRLDDVANAGLAFPGISQYRYALDQFRDRVLGDGLGVVLQQATAILTTGHQYTPPTGPRVAVTLHGVGDALRFVEQGVTNLTGQFKSGAIESGFQDLQAVYTRYQQRAGKSTSGVLSGWAVIDNAHNGLQPGELALVLGFTSQMKSTTVHNWAYHAAVWYRKNVAIVTTETSMRGLQDSFVVMHSTHPKFGTALTLTHDKLVRGELTPDEEQHLQRVVTDLMTCRDYGRLVWQEPDKASLTVGDIRRWAEQQHRQTPLDLLVIDYLGHVNPTAGGSSLRESAYANMAVRETKQLAMTFDRGRGLAVLSPWQSNREGFKEAEKNGGIYSLRAMAWAPEAEKSADLVYYVYRDSQMANANLLQMGNIKARDKRQITTKFDLFADPNLRIIEDFDPLKAHQNPVAILLQP
jgi:hypothetical protein